MYDVGNSVFAPDWLEERDDFDDWLETHDDEDGSSGGAIFHYLDDVDGAWDDFLRDVEWFEVGGYDDYKDLEKGGEFEPPIQIHKGASLVLGWDSDIFESE